MSHIFTPAGDASDNEGGRIVEDGCFLPWFTPAALARLKTFPSDLRVLEVGGGASTLWFRKNFKEVVTIDCSPEICAHLCIPCYDSVESHNLAIAAHGLFDLVIHDGAYRETNLLLGSAQVRPGGWYIVDNWQQPSCCVYSDELATLLTDQYASVDIYDHRPVHADWQTAIFNHKK